MLNLQLPAKDIVIITTAVVIIMDTDMDRVMVMGAS
jgi:hypothetical protein